MILIIDGVLTIANDLFENQGRRLIGVMEKVTEPRYKPEDEAKRDPSEVGEPPDDDYEEEAEEEYDEEVPPEDSEDEV